MDINEMIRGFEKELSAIKEKGQSDIQREENEFKADMEVCAE